MAAHRCKVIILLLAGLNQIAAGAAPSTAPVIGQWHFSQFLVGDSAHVRDLINGPLESILTRKADKLLVRARLQSELAEQVQKLNHDSPSRIALQHDRSAHVTALATAREQQDAVGLINAQNRILSDDAKLEAWRASVIETDPRLAKQKQALAEVDDELKLLEPAAINAAKARTLWIEGIRTSQHFLTPVEVGTKALLDRAKPTKIIDARTFTCDYVAFRITGELKDRATADGFRTVTYEPKLLHLQVTGIETAGLRVGATVQLDQMVRVVDINTSGRVPVHAVELSETDPRDKAFDDLLHSLTQLRVPESVKPATGPFRN